MWLIRTIYTRVSWEKPETWNLTELNGLFGSERHLDELLNYFRYSSENIIYESFIIMTINQLRQFIVIMVITVQVVSTERISISISVNLEGICQQDLAPSNTLEEGNTFLKICHKCTLPGPKSCMPSTQLQLYLTTMYSVLPICINRNFEWKSVGFLKTRHLEVTEP